MSYLKLNTSFATQSSFINHVIQLVEIPGDMMIFWFSVYLVLNQDLAMRSLNFLFLH